MAVLDGLISLVTRRTVLAYASNGGISMRMKIEVADRKYGDIAPAQIAEEIIRLVCAHPSLQSSTDLHIPQGDSAGDDSHHRDDSSGGRGR